MIPYGKQSINQDDIDAVVNVLKGDWLTTGPTVEKFESDLQKFTGGVPVVYV
jgi:dTDP-4-amino-4,6-dideoxygalactose transaminase